MSLGEGSSKMVGPLQRATAVLRALANGGRLGLSLTEIAKDLQLPHSTVHRILAQMARERFVGQDEDSRKYILGPLAFELGLAAERQFDIRGLCRPLLQRLAIEAEDTVYLVQRSGNEAVCIERQEGPSPIRVLTLEVGSRRPLGLGAGGLAILAALPHGEMEDVLGAIMPAIASRWRFPEGALRDSLQSAQENGHAVIRNRITLGTTAVGRHVKDSLGRPFAALSVAAVNSRMDVARIRQIASLLEREAKEIERLLAGLRPTLSRQ
jgi:DNA-binding IclR family transcriptional regulator